MTSSAIDSRAYAWCNLGPLADTASISREHSQGSGAAMLRGTITLAGIYRPAPGTIVQLGYSDGQNWIARLPLRLRVISSYCDPLRRPKTTVISVGCDLRYFENRKEGTRNFTTEEANPNTPEIVRRAATPAIKASWIVQKILTDLGLTAAGDIPLKNEFTIKEFDMTAGYVAELDKLCASESYLAWVNEDGQVEFTYKNPSLTTGPLITEDHIIDLNPINTGDLPAEAVFAKFKSISLSPPESGTENDDNELKKRNWEREEARPTPAVYTHNWTEYEITVTGQYKNARDKDGNLIVVDRNTIGYPDGQYKITTERYLLERADDVKAYERQEVINYITQSVSTTTYDEDDRVVSRITVSTDQWGQSRTETRYQYTGGFVGGSYTQATKDKRVFNAMTEEEYGELMEEETIEFSPLAPVKMSLGFQASYYTLKSSGTYQSSWRRVRYRRDKKTGITKTLTESSIPFISTQDGSEAISRMRDRKKPWQPVDDMITMATRLVPQSAEERISIQREFGAQRRPPQAERAIEANLKAPTVNESVQTEFIFGSSAAQTSIELSPPYVSDDRITRTGQNGWLLTTSNARTVALEYARNENKALFGYRNGVGIQVLPETIPHKPLDVFYIRINDCTAAFLTNGTTWNISPEGVTATTDALFWGVVDGASINDAWFPVAPWTTQLPSPSAVTVNPSPKPANAINIPQGFDFLNPNLSTLFSSLSAQSSASVYDRTISPGTAINPYQERVVMTAGGGAGAIIEDVKPWAPQTVSMLAGAGAGVFTSRRVSMVAGGGAGVFTKLPPVMLAGGGGGALFDVVTTAAPAPMIDFVSGTQQQWYRDPFVVFDGEIAPTEFGFTFTLTQAKTIKAVAFYDHQQNGLQRSYAVNLRSQQGNPVSLDAAGSLLSAQIPSGTTAQLNGKWRTVSVSNGRVLTPGTYSIRAVFDGEDELSETIIKNATSVTLQSGVSFGQGFYFDGQTYEGIVFPSNIGVAYMAPMLFF